MAYEMRRSTRVQKLSKMTSTNSIRKDSMPLRRSKRIAAAASLSNAGRNDGKFVIGRKKVSKPARDVAIQTPQLRIPEEPVDGQNRSNGGGKWQRRHFSRRSRSLASPQLCVPLRRSKRIDAAAAAASLPNAGREDGEFVIGIKKVSKPARDVAQLCVLDNSMDDQHRSNGKGKWPQSRDSRREPTGASLQQCVSLRRSKRIAASNAARRVETLGRKKTPCPASNEATEVRQRRYVEEPMDDQLRSNGGGKWPRNHFSRRGRSGASPLKCRRLTIEVLRQESVNLPIASGAEIERDQEQLDGKGHQTGDAQRNHACGMVSIQKVEIAASGCAASTDLSLLSSQDSSTLSSVEGDTMVLEEGSTVRLEEGSSAVDSDNSLLRMDGEDRSTDAIDISDDLFLTFPEEEAAEEETEKSSLCTDGTDELNAAFREEAEEEVMEIESSSDDDCEKRNITDVFNSAFHEEEEEEEDEEEEKEEGRVDTQWITSIDEAQFPPSLRILARALVSVDDMPRLRGTNQELYLSSGAILCGLLDVAAHSTQRIAIVAPDMTSELMTGREVGKEEVAGALIGDRLDFEIVFVPIFLENHWMLGTIDGIRNMARVYDSGSSRLTPARRKMVSKAIKTLAAHLMPERLMSTRWAPQGHQDIQTDGWNCGVHVIRNARRYLERPNSNLSSKDGDHARIRDERLQLRQLVPALAQRCGEIADDATRMAPLAENLAIYPQKIRSAKATANRRIQHLYRTRRC
ncbi:unnamed protein product [Caenorhabditis bovis]|uniref:Ubiquitin-like protease family profile domain-containing protein n=1 Tax=Caenorhabditis bovis TaxID=2654633 RepID=A0A8S1F9F9_9PELO|nr:unnamed protein product [Caenorhabditis bovis]